MENLGLTSFYGLIFGIIGTFLGGFIGAFINLKSNKFLCFILEFAARSYDFNYMLWFNSRSFRIY